MTFDPQSKTQAQPAVLDETLPTITVLAINIGNTMISAGLVIGEAVEESFTILTSDIDTIGPQLADLWSHIDEPAEARVVIASVVPAQIEPMCRIVHSSLGTEAYVVRRDLPLPMAVDVENPDTVGVDRVCAAAAAYKKLGHACVVADVGTAMTVNVVSDDGTFLGGAIMPGPHLAALALSEHTAALPKVNLRLPEQLIGKNTDEAILIGVVAGTAGALRELVERYATHLGKWPQLVLTGGGASLLASYCDFIDTYVANLTLLGIALAWHRNPVS